MSDLKVEPTKHIGLRLSESMVAAIRKSGQNTSDWLRQAAQTRIDQERGKETTHGKLEKQIDSLQKEMARLQQSESIAQAALLDLRKTLAAIQQHQAAVQQHHVRASPFSGTDERGLRPRLQHARLVADGRAGPAVAGTGQGPRRAAEETLAPYTPENPALGGRGNAPREGLSRAKNGL